MELKSRLWGWNVSNDNCNLHDIKLNHLFKLICTRDGEVKVPSPGSALPFHHVATGGLQSKNQNLLRTEFLSWSGWVSYSVATHMAWHMARCKSSYISNCWKSTWHADKQITIAKGILENVCWIYLLCWTTVGFFKIDSMTQILSKDWSL